MSSTSSSVSPALTRREAIQQTAAWLGIALTPALLTGCVQMESAVQGGVASVKPVYFTREQILTAGTVAERILPRTDSPGATDVGVPAFLDLMYGKFMTLEEQRVFAAGLAEVEAASMAAHQRTFPQLSTAQQDAILTQIAQASQTKEKTFFHLMRDLTLLGYFTSEQVGKHVTHYDPIPGVYRGCVSIAEVGNKAWTR